MYDYELMKKALKQIIAERRTVNGAFEKLIEKELTISQGYRSMASKSHLSLREFLKNENERDDTFPIILSDVDSDFIGGSYGRETKIWPLDDIDIYLPLDGKGLVYFDQNGVLPYTVLTDDTIANNPINTSRWYRNGVISSEVIINEFSEVLKRHYPAPTQVRSNGQAISIRMSQGETETGDGLGYDIVPCFSLKSNISWNSEEFYLIPDGNNGWLRTNPRLDSLLCDSLNNFHDQTYKKVVKLIKYWNKIKNLGLNSYYIEYAICRIFASKKNQNKKLSRISEGLAWGFYELNRVIKSGNQKSIINGAPPIEPGYALKLTNLIVTHFCDEASKHAVAAWKYETRSDETSAIKEWKAIFGESFGD